MAFSQNNEEEIILAHFGDNKGTFLEIGANDGITLSNCYQIALSGWKGVCVEPSKSVYDKLVFNHSRHVGVQCLNVAIGTKDEIVDFYDSGTLLKSGDVALVSSIDKEETKRWDRFNVEFNATKVESITFHTLLSITEYQTFDLISIDAEGYDYKILSQIDLKKVGCKMLIVEWNGKDKPLYQLYCESFGMGLIAENGENLIFVS